MSCRTGKGCAGAKTPPGLAGMVVNMNITRDTHVSDVAASAPATIKVFQQHGIDFCCGGHRPIAEACVEQQVDEAGLLDQLQRSLSVPTDERDWRHAPLTDLVAHIQATYHNPLREEIPRLDAMVDKVVSRHGEHYPDMLLSLQREFRALRDELLEHMMKEDEILFPAVVALEQGRRGTPDAAAWIDGPIEMMEVEHVHAGAAMAAMRQVTSNYTLPQGACPTFQGLFYGLAQFERDMHVHIHLENNIMFPRAAALARG